MQRYIRLLVWLLAGAPVTFPFLFVQGAPKIAPLLAEAIAVTQAPLDRAFEPGRYTKTQQGPAICQTLGENQWTGFVDVTTERRLFYWFVESRNDPEHDPIIFWVNGGPGGSSMMGLLDEMGPCSVTGDSRRTVPNPHSWNSNASVIFLDQPAGTGLSALAPGASWPDTDETSAVDMRFFLNIFFGRLFPERASLPLHLAGESYGGHYIPSLMDLILAEREYGSVHAFHGPIASLILVNALIENTSPEIGAWRLLCSDYRGPIFNDTVCDIMASRLPECETLTRECRLSRDVNTCAGSFAYCKSEIGVFYEEEVQAGRRNPYHIGKNCTNLPFCWDETKGNYSSYIRQPHVLQALGLPHDHPFRAVNLDVNAAFVRSKSMFRSNTLKVARAAERGVPILVLNGNEDYIVNTPGQMWLFDSLPWKGQADYQAAPWQVLGNDQGFWKQTRDGNLKFVGIDGAGHTAPGDQKEIAKDVVVDWISRWGR